MAEQLDLDEHVDGAVVGAPGAALVAREIFHVHGQAGFTAAGLLLAGERGLLHATDAEEAPLVVGDGFDEESLGLGVRGPLVVESGEEVLEGGFIFVRKHDVLGGEAVFEAVLRDALFAFRRLRAGGLLSVEAVGLNLFVGCHDASDGSGRLQQGGMIGSL